MDKPDFRLSKQRKVILEELRSVDTHPTADEVYDMVRKVMPRISLGTVYRNLEFLCSKGMAIKVGPAGAQKRLQLSQRCVNFKMSRIEASRSRLRGMRSEAVSENRVQMPWQTGPRTPAASSR